MLIDFYYKITFNSRCFLSEIRFANNLHERIFFFSHFLSLFFFFLAFRFTEFSFCQFSLTNIYFKLKKFLFALRRSHGKFHMFSFSTVRARDEWRLEKKIFTFSRVYRNFPSYQQIKATRKTTAWKFLAGIHNFFFLLCSQF